MLGRRAGAARSVLQTLRRRATTDLKGRQFFESKPLGFEELTQLARHRGFVSPSSEVYGGIKGQYDYGPVGALLKRNIASAWWRRFIQERADTVGVDTAIIQHPTTWEAAGHVANFTDPQVSCKKCDAKHRVDKIIEDKGMIISTPLSQVDKWTAEVKTKFESCKFKCSCGSTEFSDPHQFNLLMQTQAGTLRTYLRPETAQGIFVSFDRVRTSASLFLPFGIGQIGKAFRNEISPRDLLFRMREFEQLELEYFCMPDDSPRHYAEFVSDCHGFLLDHGLHPDNIRLNAYTEGLAHYALATTDIEYKFPFGWGELWGIANRGDFDLRQHGVGKTAIIDELRRSAPPQTKPVPPPPGRDLPHTVEPSVGLDRLFMAVLSDGWRTETVRRVRNDVVTAHTRTVLGIHHELAPYRVAVIPSRTDPEVRGAALALHKRLAKLVPASLDVTGTIGKRYMRQDEIGTPYILTVDPETLQDNTVTVRDRDSTVQVRMPIEQVAETLRRGDRFEIPEPPRGPDGGYVAGLE